MIACLPKRRTHVIHIPTPKWRIMTRVTKWNNELVLSVGAELNAGARTIQVQFSRAIDCGWFSPYVKQSGCSFIWRTRNQIPRSAPGDASRRCRSDTLQRPDRSWPGAYIPEDNSVSCSWSKYVWFHPVKWNTTDLQPIKFEKKSQHVCSERKTTWGWGLWTWLHQGQPRFRLERGQPDSILSACFQEEKDRLPRGRRCLYCFPLHVLWCKRLQPVQVPPFAPRHTKIHSSS